MRHHRLLVSAAILSSAILATTAIATGDIKVPTAPAADTADTDTDTPEQVVDRPGSPPADAIDPAYTEFHHADVKVKRRVKPEYPPLARAAKMEASCRARVYVDRTGKPTKVGFMQCPQIFRAPTTNALMMWRWYPPQLAGKKVPATFPIVINYKMG